MELGIGQFLVLSGLFRGWRKIRDLLVDMYRWDLKLDISQLLQESRLRLMNMLILSKLFLSVVSYQIKIDNIYNIFKNWLK